MFLVGSNDRRFGGALAKDAAGEIPGDAGWAEAPVMTTSVTKRKTWRDTKRKGCMCDYVEPKSDLRHDAMPRIRKGYPPA